jgi:5-methylthioadenosine/S-adenosylhomocysteine deaminase
MGSKGFINDGVIAMSNGKITFVGKREAAIPMKGEIVVDAKGKVAIPGLINCHTHVPMTLFRGLAEDQPLEVWLNKTIWPLESRLTAKDVHDGALLGCLEMIKNGTTTFADMYFHEKAVAKAAKESGLRGVLAEGIIESEQKVPCDRLFSESVNFAEHFNGYADGRISTMLGPHSAYSCSSDLLAKVSEKACELNIGAHMHLAESKSVPETFQKDSGLSETEFLNKIGFLKGHILAAHCINLSPTDQRILSKRDVNVAYVPVSNMKLGLGGAKIKDLTDLGVNVSLGTDGPASNNTLDMFETMKIGALLQKHVYRDPRVSPATEILGMATINGARALGLEGEIGSIDVGKRADIILVDLSKPHLKPLNDIYSTIVYSARGSDVDTVVVDGKLLMKNRNMVTIDEKAVIDEAEETASHYDLPKPLK